MATGKLPVFATAGEAIKLPLIHWREFFRFASILIALNVLGDLISVWTGGNNYPWTGGNQTTPLWSVLLQLILIIAFAVALIPFAVAWIRLAINGPGAVSGRRIWTFGGVERQFAAAGLMLGLIMTVPSLTVFGIAILVRHQTALMAALILLAVALLIAGWGCSIRLWFILVEVALQRYQGWRSSWDLSRSKIWRLIALGFVAWLPFFLGQAIGAGIEEELANRAGWLVLTILLQSVLTVLGDTAGTGA